MFIFFHLITSSHERLCIHFPEIKKFSINGINIYLLPKNSDLYCYLGTL